MSRKILSNQEVIVTEPEILHEKKIALENEIALSGAAKKNIEKSILDLEDHHTQLKTDIQSTIKKHADIEKAKKESEDKFSTFQAQANAQSIKLQHEIQVLTDQKNVLSEQIVSLQTVVSQHKREIELALRDHEVIEVDLKNESLELGEWQKKNEAAEATLKVTEEKIAEQQKNLTLVTDALKKEQSRLSDPVFVVNKKLVESMSELINDLKKQHVALLGEIEELQKESKTKKVELQKIMDESTEKLRVISLADQKLTERVEYVQRLIEDGKAKQYLNEKVKL